MNDESKDSTLDSIETLLAKLKPEYADTRKLPEVMCTSWMQTYGAFNLLTDIDVNALKAAMFDEMFEVISKLDDLEVRATMRCFNDIERAVSNNEEVARELTKNLNVGQESSDCKFFEFHTLMREHQNLCDQVLTKCKRIKGVCDES
jgi:hypothetical protein